MSDEQKFCRTCNWSSRNHLNEVQYCLRKTIVDPVEGPRIVPLNPRGERSVFGGCGRDGRFWEPKDLARMSGYLDGRLIP